MSKTTTLECIVTIASLHLQWKDLKLRANITVIILLGTPGLNLQLGPLIRFYYPVNYRDFYDTLLSS